MEDVLFSQSLSRQQLASRGKACLASCEDLSLKFRAGVRNAVAYHPYLAGEYFFGICPIVLRQDNAEINLLHETVGPGARAHLDCGLKPFRQPGGVPMQYNFLERPPAKQHHHPIPIQCGCLAGRGNVVHGSNTIAKSAPNCLQAIIREEKQFSKPKISDVFEPF